MRKAEITLHFQNVIDRPPVPTEQLYGQACSNDNVTINSWRDIWVKNIQDNHKKFGSFKEKSIGKIFEKEKYKPVVIAGAGPSLKYNAHELKNKEGVCVVSCLHNFHYLEDQGVEVDYYVTLDAGEVTIEEVYEGGSKSPDEYWEMTKKRTLLAFIGTSPRLLEKWQGEILFYNAPIPDGDIIAAIDAIEPFNQFVSTGGNVLGACFYIAKGWLGAGMIAFVGADFSFSYDRKFHPWDSKYDKTLGHVIRAVDVYGNSCVTWQSYNNFKSWFDCMFERVPGFYVNCTEGGTLGAYREGNILSIRQMELKEFLGTLHMSKELKDQALNPAVTEKRLLF